MTREELLVTLAAQILAMPDDRARTVAIDGMSGTGKSTLAAELAGIVTGAGRPVVSLSYDDFHFPADRRHRRGRLSATGYLEDAYDADALDRLVLGPLAAGDGSVVPASYDLAGDVAVAPGALEVPDDGIVVVEGEFLLGRHEGWDLAVLLVADPAVVLERVLVRDGDLGSPDQVRELYLRRYFAAWSMYEERSAPWRVADLVVDLSDPHAPHLVSGA